MTILDKQYCMETQFSDTKLYEESLVKLYILFPEFWWYALKIHICTFK